MPGSGALGYWILPDALVDRLRFRVRLHAEHPAQQLATSAVNLQYLAVVPQFPMADHQSSIEIFRYLVEFDTCLIDVRRLMPEPLALVSPRGVSNRAKKLVAERVPRLDCPRFV